MKEQKSTTCYTFTPCVVSFTCLSIEHWIQGTLWHYVTCDWQIEWPKQDLNQRKIKYELIFPESVLTVNWMRRKEELRNGWTCLLPRWTCWGIWCTMRRSWRMYQNMWISGNNVNLFFRQVHMKNDPTMKAWFWPLVVHNIENSYLQRSNANLSGAFGHFLWPSSVDWTTAQCLTWLPMVKSCDKMEKMVRHWAFVQSTVEGHEKWWFTMR